MRMMFSALQKFERVAKVRFMPIILEFSLTMRKTVSQGHLQWHDHSFRLRVIQIPPGKVATFWLVDSVADIFRVSMLLSALHIQ